MDAPSLNVAQYPSDRGGLLVSGGYIFRGIGGMAETGGAVFAQRIDVLKAGIFDSVRVSRLGYAIGATRNYAFIRTRTDLGSELNQLFAIEITRMADESQEALRLIVTLRDRTGRSRTEATSDKYCVWQDRDPEVPDDSWKIYARRTEDLFKSGSERLVVDTKVYRQQPTGTQGVPLHLEGSILIYQGARENDPNVNREIYLLDLDGGSEPISIASVEDPADRLEWPAVSEHYAVWTRIRNITDRVPYARRLVDGRPAGENFVIGSGKLGGSWITIDGNIAVWNGGTTLVNGEVLHDAVIAAELPIPGAQDIGDANLDGKVDITDAIFLLKHLFFGGPQPRRRLADMDRDERLSLQDVVYLIDYLFLGRARPDS